MRLARSVPPPGFATRAAVTIKDEPHRAHNRAGDMWLWWFMHGFSFMWRSIAGWPGYPSASRDPLRYV